MGLYRLVVVGCVLVGLSESIIPACSKEGVWIPLTEITGNRRDPAQYSTHFCLVKSADHFTTNPRRFTWDEAAGACNSFKGFLLYSFNISHLLTIVESYSTELAASGSGVAQAPLGQRMLFISLHDKGTEGVLTYDMRWLFENDVPFTAPINQTAPHSPVNKLITKGKFQGGLTIWEPAANGALPTKLADRNNNNDDDNDCMAIVLLPDGKLQPVFVNCGTSRADQAICVRDGLLSTRSSPCSLDFRYSQLTDNTDVLGVAAIHSSLDESRNKFFYAESVSEAKRKWLNPTSNIRSFMLPNARNVYFLVLCKPGWFPTQEVKYPVSFATCQNNSDISSSARQYGPLCGFYDGCQDPDGENSMFKGTHTVHCSSHGYCKPDKIAGTVSCTCQLGYTGLACEDIDYNPCNDTSNPNPCGEGQKCMAQQRDYYCVCQGRLSYNKYSCHHDVDECESNPCRNGATCSPQQNTFHCDCTELMDPNTKQKVKYANGEVAYWNGQLCDRDPINSCQPNPCVGKADTDYVQLYGRSPAGTCRDKVIGFECACDYPWSGSICEVYDSDNIVQAITGRRRSLIYVYLAFFIFFNFACMLLTLLRRREITQGRYKTEEMIISAYESERKVERDKLMQFVEDAAYSSDEDEGDNRRGKHEKNSLSKAAAKLSGKGPTVRSNSNVASASAVNMQDQDGFQGITTETDPNTNVGFQDDRSLKRGKKRKLRARLRKRV